MAIFYLDYLNGNDANDGSSWANAWKTTQNGATAARIAPGDVIRIAKSPDPVSIGTATWNGESITGEDVTFDSAPTKFLTDGTSGWVTYVGTTVTNNQSTAWVVGRVGSGAAGYAVSVAASSQQQLMRKDLGSDLDLSSYQQINFWFRPSAAFDCSGAQNMYVRLCSDTNGTTVVNEFQMPKWNYNANTWYPIVIDYGSALGGTIRSIGVRQTTSTTLTYYFDEFFVSPAGGLTLWTLLGKHTGTSETWEQLDWYGVCGVQDNKVTLWNVGYGPATAQGASAFNSYIHKSCGWFKTENVTTYIRECIRPFPNSTTGPQSTSYPIYFNDNGTYSSTYGNPYIPIEYSGGWNTSTTEQDGYTFIDQLTCTCDGVYVNSKYGNHVERFGMVRTYTGFNFSYFNTLNDCSVIQSVINPLYSNSSNYDVNLTGKYANYSLNSVTGSSGTITFETSAYGLSTKNPIFGNIRTTGTVQLLNSYCKNVEFQDMIFGNTSNNFLVLGFNSNFKCKSVRTVKGPVYPNGLAGYLLSFYGGNVNVEIQDVFSVKIGSTSTSNYNQDSVMYIHNVSGDTTVAFGSQTVKVNNWNSTNPSILNTTSSTVPGVKCVLMDFNNVSSDQRVYVGTPGTGTSGFALFQTEGIDVHTAGSLSWKYTGANMSSYAYGLPFENYLKMASVAVEANKLVTITCYVKGNGTSNDIGIRVPVNYGLVPGYSTDIIEKVTTSGSWEQVTLTFTPTANCVIDVEMYIKQLVTSAPIGVWDDLVITQAA